LIRIVGYIRRFGFFHNLLAQAIAITSFGDRIPGFGDRHVRFRSSPSAVFGDRHPPVSAIAMGRNLHFDVAP
jgi:hypothetical protein